MFLLIRVGKQAERQLGAVIFNLPFGSWSDQCSDIGHEGKTLAVEEACNFRHRIVQTELATIIKRSRKRCESIEWKSDLPPGELVGCPRFTFDRREHIEAVVSPG